MKQLNHATGHTVRKQAEQLLAYLEKYFMLPSFPTSRKNLAIDAIANNIAMSASLLMKEELWRQRRRDFVTMVLSIALCFVAAYFVFTKDVHEVPPLAVEDEWTKIEVETGGPSKEIAQATITQRSAEIDVLRKTVARLKRDAPVVHIEPPPPDEPVAVAEVVRHARRLGLSSARMEVK